MKRKGSNSGRSCSRQKKNHLNWKEDSRKRSDRLKSSLKRSWWISFMKRRSWTRWISRRKGWRNFNIEEKYTTHLPFPHNPNPFTIGRRPLGVKTRNLQRTKGKRNGTVQTPKSLTATIRTRWGCRDCRSHCRKSRRN